CAFDGRSILQLRVQQDLRSQRARLAYDNLRANRPGPRVRPSLWGPNPDRVSWIKHPATGGLRRKLTGRRETLFQRKLPILSPSALVHRRSESVVFTSRCNPELR